ncbi:MAG: methylated-DNA--[protein]-cysteine S-methyltransferase [Planctomycetota bacterium]|nr:methylated-DNA--[protein]-cysteine S-methyltransferase [Planctomycetota bacterium]
MPRHISGTDSDNRRTGPLHVAWITGPLGDLLAAGRGGRLVRLLFADSLANRRKAALQEALGSEYECADLPVLQLIASELDAYFSGTLRRFRTRVSFSGTPFQIRTWEELCRIPHGSTISYSELAARVGRPRACRAVAQANGANCLPIIVPCHRVINKDGGLGGFSAGLEKKEWLLAHEKAMAERRGRPR